MSGWPRPDPSFGEGVGLNRFRMLVLIGLAVAGLAVGYLVGKYVKPRPPEVPAPVTSTPAAPSPETLKKSASKTVDYEESLPRDIILEADGVLTRIALPEPDAEIDFGPFARLTETAPPAPAPDAPTTEAARVPEKPVPPTATPAPPPRIARALPADIAALQRTRGESLPAWQRYAQAVDWRDGPKIVIVIDDLGLNRPLTRETIGLPGPLTLSFLAYAEDLAAQTRKARDAGHELMLHVPMEPGSTAVDPGPNVLLSGMAADELRKNVAWNLDQADGYVGINNHMGSRFTADTESMRTVADILRSRGLLFLDSVTSSKSVAHEVAKETRIPFAVRNVFLDHDDDLTAIRRQLATVERIAERTGLAIAIGHPRRKTLAALADWLPGLAEKGFQLVPISAVARIAGGG